MYFYMSFGVLEYIKREGTLISVEKKGGKISRDLKTSEEFWVKSNKKF